MKAFLLFTLLALAGCINPIRRTRAVTPPAPLPAKMPPVEAPEATASKPLPEPPQLDAQKPSVQATEVPAAVHPTAPPTMPPRSRPTPKAAKKIPPAPKPETTEAEEESNPAPAFQLGEVMTPQQREEYRLQTDALILASQKVLSVAGQRRLTPQQSETVSRIASFLQQAKEAREKSPSEAKSLAERAKLFADRLASEFQ